MSKSKPTPRKPTFVARQNVTVRLPDGRRVDLKKGQKPPTRAADGSRLTEEDLKRLTVSHLIPK